MNRRHRRAEAIRQLLDTEGDAVYEAATHFNEARYEVLGPFDRYESLRSEARAVKEAAIDKLPDLIETATASVEANGGEVYFAEDATDANDYIGGVLKRAGAETVVKSKSMTTEELSTNEALETAGIEVVETDLGEFVLQVADESPSHLIAPGMHKSRAAIAELFNERFSPTEPLETAEELTAFARDYLGTRISRADAGMTGANFVLAETGTIVLVTNEGNARKCAVTPPVHIAVAGVEKLVPSVGEIGPFLELIAKAGTGQPVANYLTMLSPPVESPTIDFASDDPIGAGGADRTFHLVLVDNGRFGMREDDQLRETLYCIRCGACANTCANFQHVGGHAFGGETYTGGIATGWEAGLRGSEAAGFNDLCTGCSRCVEACPVQIDIPWINTVVRDRLNRDEEPPALDALVDGLVPDAEPDGFDRQKRFFGNAETLLRLGSATAPVSNWLANRRPTRWLLDRTVGLDRRRDLPTFARQSFRAWYDARGSTLADPAAEVVLYPDVFTNYVAVDRGKAAVRVLEALGVGVRVPSVPESGRAPLSQGMIATARRQADAVFEALRPHLEADRPVVVIEPTDLGMFCREYDRLLAPDRAGALADGCHELMAYVHGQLANGADPDRLGSGAGDRVAYHSHCQQRTLGLAAHTPAVLDRLGYDVETTDVECCGMAGSFGYKTEYYELSVDVGEPLVEQVGDAPTIVATGTSCAEQLTALLDRPVDHPVALLDPGPS